MGRAGIEPATLGLKVRAELMRRGAADGKVLQLGRLAITPSCNELRLAEASPYSNPYSRCRLLTERIRYQVRGSSPRRRAGYSLSFPRCRSRSNPGCATRSMHSGWANTSHKL